MDRFFDSIDTSMFPPMDVAMINDVLADSTRTASELLMLHFACLTNDAQEIELIDAAQRIAVVISDMADDGDEDAMMAMVAISTLYSEDASEADTVVGVAMLRAVASRPLLRNVISGDIDHETATAALSVIDMLADQLLGDVYDLEDLDDLDDLDIEEFAAQLGISDLDLDLDGDSDDR